MRNTKRPETTIFSSCANTKEVVALYRKLVKELHPDTNPGIDAAKFRAVQDEYDFVMKSQIFAAWKSAEQTKQSNYSEKGWTYKETVTVWEVEEISELLADLVADLVFIEDIQVEIAGLWLWVTGNTYACKSVLKAKGFTWMSKKVAWAYMGVETHSRKFHTLEEVRAMHHSKVVVPNKVSSIA